MNVDRENILKSLVYDFILSLDDVSLASVFRKKHKVVSVIIVPIPALMLAIVYCGDRARGKHILLETRFIVFG